MVHVLIKNSVFCFKLPNMICNVAGSTALRQIMLCCFVFSLRESGVDLLSWLLARNGKPEYSFKISCCITFVATYPTSKFWRLEKLLYLVVMWTWKIWSQVCSVDLVPQSGLFSAALQECFIVLFFVKLTKNLNTLNTSECEWLSCHCSLF